MLRRAASNERTFSCFETRIFWPVVPWRYAGMQVCVCIACCVLLVVFSFQGVQPARSITTDLGVCRLDETGVGQRNLSFSSACQFLDACFSGVSARPSQNEPVSWTVHHMQQAGKNISSSILVCWSREKMRRQSSGRVDCTALGHQPWHRNLQGSASELGVWSMAHSVWGAFEDC